MKLEFLNNAEKHIYIDLQNEVFTGDVLDIGLDNYGIIYSLYKLQNENAKVDYIQGREEKELIENESYDSCILMFSLSSIWLKSNKKSLFKDISQFLKKEGTIQIWDIDKNYTKFFRGKIKVLLPNNNVKEINLTDLNLLKDTSIESTIKLMEQYFEIIDLKAYDNVYYIKGKKRDNAVVHANVHSKMEGSTDDEDSVSSNKFKIRSQQLSSKISKGLYKRFK